MSDGSCSLRAMGAYAIGGLLLGSLAILALRMWVVPGTSEESQRRQAPDEAKQTNDGGAAKLGFEDSFNGPELDNRLWKITRQGDFQESKIDVVEGRLRMRLGTMGTRDDTVKFHGVRTLRSFDLSSGGEVSFEVDWNNQANGCYLTAGIYLCPSAVDDNPRDESCWLKFEYIGVPPGKNARPLLAVIQNNHLRHLYAEGWPDEQRVGRRIGREKVRLVFEGGLVRLWENGAFLFEDTLPPSLLLSEIYLYLQMSSHSNYPAREVFFDNVRLITAKGD